VALKITKLGRSDLDALKPSYAFAATRITITIQAFHRFFYKSGPLTGVRRHIARLPRALQACTLSSGQLTISLSSCTRHWDEQSIAFSWP
jgi:hypothetical protein